jgi:hypothetical protein
MLSTFIIHVSAGSGPRDGSAKSTWINGYLTLETNDIELQALEVSEKIHDQLILSINAAFDPQRHVESLEPDECKSAI